MPIAPLPTPLQHLGGRRFSFYPPIRNIEHNEWVYRRATWSECVVANMQSGEELCIPRMFIGEVSSIEEPVVIVGLSRELEWNAGAVIPHRRHGIELPVAVNEGRPAPSRPARLAPVINIRLEPRRDTRAAKWIGVALVVGVAVFTIVADIARQSQRGWQQLSGHDDYVSVIRKLGRPAEDHSRDLAGDTYRVLGYTPWHFSVILMDSRYVGTLDGRGRVLDAADRAALRSLPAF
jgi:hypothetical protein